MYKVCKGCKEKNVKDENGKIRNYYGGEILPKDFIPHISHIKQKIVEELTFKKASFKGDK